MPLGPQFAQIGRVRPRRFTPKRSCQELGVCCLPLPVNPAAPLIPFHHHSHDGIDDPLPHPLLKAAMGGRTGAVATRKSFPLTAGTQNEEDAVHDLAERYGWTSRSARVFLRR